MRSTSGLVMTRGHLHDNEYGFESTRASISDQCRSLRDSVDWENSNAPSGLVAKYLLPPLVDWLRESVHIGIHCHPIEEGEVLSLGLLNASCRALWGLF